MLLLGSQLFLIGGQLSCVDRSSLEMCWNRRFKKYFLAVSHIQYKCCDCLRLETQMPLQIQTLALELPQAYLPLSLRDK